MTILQSLASYYDRMAARGEAEPPGFNREKISFAVVIDSTGEPVGVMDLRDSSGKRPVPTLRDVPASQKRTVAIAPNFLWDKTAYSLGVTARESKRTAQEHQAFCDLHYALLADATDEGLFALHCFLDKWAPERFSSVPFTPEMLDTNFVFQLDGDLDGRGRPRFIHERPAARSLIEERSSKGETGFCLITGTEGSIARLHPGIKGVYADSPPPGGSYSLVSFNLPAFESWGKTQGTNAPTGQAAAFRYGAALNRLLERGSRNRIRIGDATVAFWAEAGATEEDSSAADAFLASLFGEVEKRDDYDAQQAAKLREALEPLAKGQPARVGTDALHPETCIHILGLSPNGPRLSVRFWLTESLGKLASNLCAHEHDCRIEPLPRQWGAGPSINRLLVKTVAAQEKWENIPPRLAGEVARAVLGGSPYPRTLLSNAIMRLRAGDDPRVGWHAAAIRAVLMRSHGGGGEPVSLDKQDTNPAYRLGRLFAVLEEAQERALGRGVNATIRDRYFGAASAAPARVFPLLLRGVQNHLGKLRKEELGAATVIEIKLGEVMEGLASELPRSLRLEDQGRFAIGYYHQRSARFAKKDGAPHEQGD